MDMAKDLSWEKKNSQDQDTEKFYPTLRISSYKYPTWHERTPVSQ